jgi:hypothetical protein
LVDLFTNLRAGQDDLARHEDKQDNLRLHHAVNETREEFRLVGRESVVARCKTLQANGELDVAGTDDILDLEILVIVSMSSRLKPGATYGELCVEPQLLDDPRIFPGSKAAVILRLGTGDDHLSTCEDQSRCLGLTNTHDDGCETLGVVLSVARVQSDSLEV